MFINKIKDIFDKNKSKYNIFTEDTELISNNVVEKNSIQVQRNLKEDFPYLWVWGKNEPNTNIAYFKNGKLYDVKPRNKEASIYEDRVIALTSRFFILDGIMHDFESADSISQIKIPKIKQASGIESPVLNLDYILKMRAIREYRPWLAVPLIYKTVNFMLNSTYSETKNNYFRMVKHLWRMGAFKHGDYLLNELNKLVPCMTDDNYIRKSIFLKAIQDAKRYDSDLIEVEASNRACSECAKYQGRLYSISGKNKRFPQLPQFIKNNYGLHCDNYISANILFTLYEEKDLTIDTYNYDSNGKCTVVSVNAIKYSNRPFIDNRSNFEKENYKKWAEEKTCKKRYEEQYFSKDLWVEDYYKHLEYQEIVTLLGEKAPKSYSGYRRMKNGNTKNYQKIVTLAEENGITINTF